MKLTDTQLVMMSRAAQRDDLALERPETLRGNAPNRSVAALLKADLVAETASAAGMPVWRRGEGEAALSLVLTRAGLDALGVAPEERGETDGTPIGFGPDLGPPPRPTDMEPDEPQTETRSPAAGTKLGEVLAMLRRNGGANLEEMVAATGWQAHSVRAALTGLKKRGFIVLREKADGSSRYRIAAGGAEDADDPDGCSEAGADAKSAEA